MALRQTKITNKGLKEIAGLAKLFHINLSVNEISDGGLNEPSGLKLLIVLELENTDVPNESVKTILEFKQLINLDLRKSKLTIEGVKQVLKSVPFRASSLLIGGLPSNQASRNFQRHALALPPSL